MHCCLIILELVEKIRLEKLFKPQDEDFHINQPNCLTALSQIDYAFITKSTLIDPSNYAMTGAIIQENYYTIEEEKLKDLNHRINLLSPSPTHMKKKEFKITLETLDFSGYFL